MNVWLTSLFRAISRPCLTSGRSTWLLEDRLLPWVVLPFAIVLATAACARTPEPPPPTPASAANRSPEPPPRAESAPSPATVSTKERAPRGSARLQASEPPAPVPLLKPEAGRGIAGAQSARAGESFDLRIGEIVAIVGEPLTVSFEQVVEDSRCPANVACVWAGTAVVRIGLRGANSERGVLNLQTLSEDAGEGTFQQYRLRLVQLVPSPRESGRIPADQYHATLMVRKME